MYVKATTTSDEKRRLKRLWRWSLYISIWGQHGLTSIDLFIDKQKKPHTYLTGFSHSQLILKWYLCMQIMMVYVICPHSENIFSWAYIKYNHGQSDNQSPADSTKHRPICRIFGLFRLYRSLLLFVLYIVCHKHSVVSRHRSG